MTWGSTPEGARYFSPLQNAQTGSGAHSPFYSVGNRDNFPRVKLPEQEIDHSPPSRTKVRRSVAIHLLILLDLMVWTEAILPFTSTSRVYGIREYHRHTETNMTSSTTRGQFHFIQFPFGHVITHTEEPKIIKFHFSSREKVTVQDFMSNLFQFSSSTWHW